MLTKTNFPSRSLCENVQNIEGPTIVDPPKNCVYSKTSKNMRILKLVYDILLLEMLLSHILSTHLTGKSCALENLLNRNIRYK